MKVRRNFIFATTLTKIYVPISFSGVYSFLGKLQQREECAPLCLNLKRKCNVCDCELFRVESVV